MTNTHRKTIESITGMVHQIEMEKTSYQTENLKLKVMVQSQECLKNSVVELVENLVEENSILFEIERLLSTTQNKELHSKLQEAINKRATVLNTINQRMQVIADLRNEIESDEDLQCQHYNDDFIV